MPGFLFDERNFHAHILTTTRLIEATGLGAKTSIEWAESERAKRGLKPAKEEIAEIRERWAVLTNETLQALGHEARVVHRSLEAQGCERGEGAARAGATSIVRALKRDQQRSCNSRTQ